MSYKDIIEGLPSINRSSYLMEIGRSESPTTRKQLGESNTSNESKDYYDVCIHTLQDQVKLFREEMKKKDELIQRLSAMEIKGIPNRLIDATMGAGISAHSSRSEVAALQVKLDAMQTKMREKQVEVDTKEETISILRREIEMLKEDNARQATLNVQLKKQIEEMEGHFGAFEVLKSRNSYAVSALQEQNRDTQERLLELETRLKSNAIEREKIEHSSTVIEKRYHDLMATLTEIVGFVDSSDTNKILEKIRESMSENHMLKGRILTLQEAMSATELEQKASRETIMRLVAEVGKEQDSYNSHYKAKDHLQHSLDKANVEKKDLETQVALLEQRLEASQKTLSATRNELSEKEGILSKLHCESKEKSFAASSTEKQFSGFIESIAGLLSNAYSSCPASEEAVRERIKRLVSDHQENQGLVDSLETRLKNVTQQFTVQYENSREADMKIRRAEGDYFDMKERIRILEGELAAADVLRDGLRADKEKFFKYMQQLAQVMKMDEINSDIGFDMLGEGLIARSEQLIRLEVDKIADRSTAVHTLQRKIKAMKDQLESKDLHLDLLRKKIAALEERIHDKSDLERERDHENDRSRKLHRMLEKSQRQLEESRAEIVELKAQLLECSNLKLTVIEQDKELQTLEKTLEKLEGVRQKQAKRIRGLRDEVDIREKEIGDKRVLSENAVQGLSSELRTTKAALEEMRRKERQLFEFRAVIARMLGLDLDSLSIPDYEIINRLERLVQAHQSNVYTAFSVDQGLRDMEDGFRTGFEDAQRLLGRSRGRRSISPSKRNERTRSPSPQSRDNRRY